MAFLHDGISMKRLGHTTSGHYADSFGVNAQGQAVGSFVSRRRVSLAGGYFGDLAGGLHEVPTLGGLGCHALGINDAGQVIGSSETGAFGPNNRFLLHAFVWSEGVTRDLGMLPGDTSSVALGINNAGDIVGDSFSDCFSLATFRAVLWPRGGAPIDLNTRIPAGSGFQLTIANAINASGQVLSGGIVIGQTQNRAYLLTPVP
jgi:probable HAF family extracellular repeat protein